MEKITTATVEDIRGDVWCNWCMRLPKGVIRDGGMYDHDGMRVMCAVHLNAAIRAGNVDRTKVVAPVIVSGTQR